MVDPEFNNHDCDTGQTLMSIEDTLKLLMDSAKPVRETETLPIADAHDRILAEDLTSTINVPPHNNSAMDGYAVRSSDFSQAKEVSLPVSQRIPAGSTGTPLEAGTVARIFTGAPIPPEADAVVMQEFVTVKEEGAQKYATISGPIRVTDNIRNAGEDIKIDDVILKKGTKLKPQDMGLIASVGIPQVTVFKRLRVGIFFTGDELREPTETLESGQIYNSNRYTMRGLLKSLNCEIIDLGTVEDSLDATKAAMLKASEQADLILTSGGVSVGEEDYIRIALEELGQLDLWRINIKPGKPLAFGKVGDTPFLGMPGNPVSVFATFCIFARSFILQTQGCNKTKANSFKVPANFSWGKAGSRNEYLRAKLVDGQLEIYPNQSSGVLTSTSWADGFAFVPSDEIVKPNDQVEFIPMSEFL